MLMLPVTLSLIPIVFFRCQKLEVLYKLHLKYQAGTGTVLCQYYFRSTMSMLTAIMTVRILHNCVLF